MRTESSRRHVWCVGILVLALFVAGPATAQEERSIAAASTRVESTGWLDAERFSVGVPLEATVVGFSVGLRPELLYRPFGADGGTHVRLAAGVMPGLEFTFVPLDIGWRHIFRRDSVVQPLVGVGYEHQIFVIEDVDNIDRGALYLEGGTDFRVASDSHVGVHLAMDVGVFSRPGFGLSSRVMYRLDF